MKTHTPIVDWLRPYWCFKWIRKGTIYFPGLPNWLENENKGCLVVQLCLCVSRLCFCSRKRKEKRKHGTVFAVKTSGSELTVSSDEPHVTPCPKFKHIFVMFHWNDWIVGQKSDNADDWGDFSLRCCLRHVLHTSAAGLDFTDIMPAHTKKTALWHITEGSVRDPELLKFIVQADGGTSERLMAKSHPTLHLTAPLKSGWA